LDHTNVTNKSDISYLQIPAEPSNILVHSWALLAAILSKLAAHFLFSALRYDVYVASAPQYSKQPSS